MLEFGSVKEQAPAVQIYQYLRVGVFYKQSRKRRFLCQIALSVNKLNERKVIFPSYSGIVLAESRRNVNDSRTVGQRYVIIRRNKMRLFVLLLCRFIGTLKERLILCSHQFPAYISFQNFVCRLSVLSQLCHNRVQQSLRHDIGIAVRRLYLCISLLRIYAERGITGQGPGRGCPCQEILILSFQLKTDSCGTFLNGFIALCHLMGG